MDEDKFHRLLAGLDRWQEDFGAGMETRGKDDLSWYDLSVNANSLPCTTDTAIVVTAWQGQLKWLKAVLTGYRKTGAFVILAYDNPFYPWMAYSSANIIRCLPNQQHYILANSMVMKHITYDSDKRNGWFWSVRYAQGVIKSFPNIKQVYVTNGDCIFEKPEGMPQLVKLLDDCDVISGQNTASSIHTANVLFNIDAFNEIVDYMTKMMTVPVIGSRSPEGNLKEAIDVLGVKMGIAPVQPQDKDGTIDPYARYGPDSTWRQLVGFRNLFAEYETCGNEGLEVGYLSPYVDDYQDHCYWGGEERTTVCPYWKTKDRRYLMKWWDQWEDSDYNRLYYPIEHYGKEPIYGVDKS